MSFDGAVDFVKTVRLQFMPPQSAKDKDQQDAWLKLMWARLERFDDATLARAAMVLIERSRPRLANGSRDNFFPPLAECIEECVKARAYLDGEKLPLEAKQQNLIASNKPKFAAHESLANALLDSPTAKNAASEGWINGFYDFVRANGREPNVMEMATLRRAAAEVEEFYHANADKIEPDTANTKRSMRSMLAQMAGKMLTRRKELSDKVLAAK